jgi:hypothetical protein
MSHRSFRRLFLLLLPGALVACARVGTRAPVVQQAGAKYSQLELQIDVVELGREMMHTVEIAADSIDSLTTDPAVRRNTLLWRISTVPAATEAVLRPDPVIAMLDLYVLRVQQSEFLASPAGANAFGDALPVAQQAMDRVQQQWSAVVTTIGATLPDSDRVRLDAWAHEHPLDRLPFVRPSPVTGLTSRLRMGNASLGSAVGGMQESLDRLEARISLANEYVAKQVGWMAQLSAMDLKASPEAGELMATLQATRGLVDSAYGMFDTGTGLITRERQAALADVDRQRRETLAALAAEREILLKAIADERERVLAAVDQQRRLALEAGDSLRVRIIADEIRVIDHLVWRLAELFGGLLLVLGAWALVRRRRASAPVGAAE